VSGTISGNKSGYQAAVLNIITSVVYYGTVDASGAFKVAVPKNLSSVAPMAWKDLNANGGLDLSTGQDAYSIVALSISSSGIPTFFSTGSTDVTGISIVVGAPASLTVTIDLPAPAASAGSLQVELVSNGVSTEEQYFGPSTGSSGGFAQLTAGQSSATFSLGGVQGGSYTLDAVFDADGLIDISGLATDGSASNSSMGSMNLTALSSGSQSLTLSVLKWHTLAGSASNLVSGSWGLYIGGSFGGLDSSTESQTWATTGGTQSFSIMALGGYAYSIGAYEILDSSKLAGNLFGWYGGSGLAEPSPLVLSSAKTGLSISLSAVTSAHVSGKLLAPADIDGDTLDTFYFPDLIPITPSTVLSGGTKVSGGYEYPFSAEVPVPASSEISLDIYSATSSSEVYYGTISTQAYTADTTLSSDLVLSSVSSPAVARALSPISKTPGIVAFGRQQFRW
jgi:hypothetical protein